MHVIHPFTISDLYRSDGHAAGGWEGVSWPYRVWAGVYQIYNVSMGCPFLRVFSVIYLSIYITKKPGHEQPLGFIL